MRALVVEDEKTPRELLRDLVPWAKHGFDRVDTARNGLEALEILEAGGVDLVVTDVRMPKMDGIELAVEVRRRWPDCVLVFLSGYSDKEYLKTAIRVQAQDYLDKPIDLTQVEASVAQAAATVQRRKLSHEETERDEKLLKELSPLRRQAQAQALFGLGTGPWATLEDRFVQGPLRALVLDPGDQADPGPAWVPSVLALVNGDAFPFPSFAAAPGPRQSVVLACDRFLAADPTSFDRAVEELLALVSAADPSEEPRIGVSAAVPGPQGLPAALEDARGALVDSFYRPAQRVYPVRPASGRTLDLPADTVAGWGALMDRGDTDAVLRQLELLEQRTLATRDPDLDRVRAVWLGGLAELFTHVPAWGPAEIQARTERLRREFEAAPSLAALAATARDCFERLFVRSPGDLHAEDKVLKARAFIETRFTDPDLTVDAIAAHVGFSESYFCTVFKQTEGTTVKDWVTRFRIERAKAYLWEKDPPTLADLALKVGFRDPNYFSTVFKRLTGTSPGAYRKKALG
jgi:two-component system response regulator YesN